MNNQTIKKLINQAGWYKLADVDEYMVTKQQAMDFAELVIKDYLNRYMVQPANPRSEMRYEEALRDYKRNVERIMQALVTTKT